MTFSYKTIHRDFQLNGIHYSRQELKEVAYSLVKEGEPFEQSIGDFLIDWLDRKPTIEVKTSGSTGKPKRLDLQKLHMVNSATATGAFFGLEPGSSVLLCLPVNFIAGKMMLVRAMVLGLKLDYVAPISSPLQSNSQQYDFCAMVPLQVENSLGGFSGIKTLIVGGAPLSQELKAQVQVQKTMIFETYGMTETITHIAVKKINNVGPSEITERKQRTVKDLPYLNSGISKNHFKTLPEVSISIDERDCLVIEAPKVADKPIVTNDVVELVSDTEFKWLGRFDNVINSGGIKLFPEQIEAKLASLIKSRFFVAGLPDEKLGQKLALAVEGSIDSNKLLQEIKSLKSLQKFEVPKEVHVITGFRETANGKICRSETLDLFMV